ncbi:MAG: UMP kinase [Legionellales bacterium]|nr:UMP kinase [Legionellales bacterium]
MEINRILLKLSGEYLSGNSKNIFDNKILDKLAVDIGKIVDMGIDIGIVVGGGNILRGGSISMNGFDRLHGDHMGMLATAINGLAIDSILKKNGVKSKVFSSVAMDGISEPFNAYVANESFKEKYVNIFTVGTGSPFFTTDTAACLRAIEIGADMVLKATKVDGVYSDDPKINPDAKYYSKITYNEVLAQELKVMDLTAILLCKEHKMPLRVVNLADPNALLQAASGENIGTIVYEEV